MSYTQVHKSPFGKHIVESVNGFYIRVPDHAWSAHLLLFRANASKYDALLGKLLTRAAKRCEYDLYRRVKRAVQRRNPQPMPWNHVMFTGCKMPQEKE